MNAWKRQIEHTKEFQHYSELILKGAKLEFYATIPKNKATLYSHFAWNPDMTDQCENKLGQLFSQMFQTPPPPIPAPERSPSTTISNTLQHKEMVEHTFCPDCDSLLFIQQNTVTDEATGNSRKVLNKCCSICGWKKQMEDALMNEPIYVTKGTKQHFKITDYDISEILMDPTLPRINNIPCVNTKCPTNHLVGDEYGFIVEDLSVDERERISELNDDRVETFGETGIVVYADKEDELKTKIQQLGLTEDQGNILKGPIERHIVYYRTNPSELSYSYICSTCKTVWSNH